LLKSGDNLNDWSLSIKLDGREEKCVHGILGGLMTNGTIFLMLTKAMHFMSKKSIRQIIL
jgi:hypothetical protein